MPTTDSETYFEMGETYALGYLPEDGGRFVIHEYDSSEPVAEFARTEEGWTRVWGTFRELEPDFTEGETFATPDEPPDEGRFVVEPNQLVLMSADAAVRVVGTKEFQSLTMASLRLVGKEIARHVTSEDAPGLFVPSDVVLDGKDRLGGALVLDDRLIIAWTIGTFRIKNYEVVLPRAEIQGIERTERSATALMKPREGLRIVGRDTWDLVFANAFEGGTNIVPIVLSVWEGALKLEFGDGNQAKPT